MALDEAPDLRVRQNTPLWMDTSPPNPGMSRRGAVPTSGGGLHTLLFFGLIVVAVGAAGLLGIALWGPEKPVANRARLASEPPPPAPLPSLPPTVESVAAPAPSAPPAASAEPAPPAKKAKRTIAAPKSKRH